MVVKSLRPPDTHHLSASIGWLELGNPAEARAELAKVAPALKNHPDVMEVRWQIDAAQKKWDDCLQTAQNMIAFASERASGWIHRAYALRRVEGGGLEAARVALTEGFAKFPEEPIIPYNLACYECQLGRLQHALILLSQSFSIGKAKMLKAMALEDTDLEPLWEKIREL